MLVIMTSISTATTGPLARWLTRRAHAPTCLDVPRTGTPQRRHG
jgi:hypothetical protein